MLEPVEGSGKRVREMHQRRWASIIGLVGVAVGVGLVLGGVTAVSVVPWLLLALSRVVRWLG